MEPKDVALIVPTLNAGTLWRRWLQALDCQTFRPQRFLLVDSSSNDQTVPLGRHAGFETHVIPRREFDHGGTRQLAVQMVPGAAIVIFLTQDAILAHAEALAELIAPFEDSRIGAVYGRQLPRLQAGPMEAHARLFNYPAISLVKSMDDVPRMGIKTTFMSNSFSAYRRTALIEVGGFASGTALSEDVHVAARMLLAGWQIAYRAEARVYHSHGHGYLEEFKRYVDIGAFHSREPWIRQRFGSAEGEGARYVKSELRYVWKTRPRLVPSALLRNALKLVGYRIGIWERFLPVWIKRRLSIYR
jgi:rhamnosyltransferase